jgi:hypothetical protein
MIERRAHVVVGQHVAGTDDHGNPAAQPILVLSVTIDTSLFAHGQKENCKFTRIPNYSGDRKNAPDEHFRL